MKNNPGGFYDEKINEGLQQPLQDTQTVRKVSYGNIISGIIGIIVGVVFIIVGIWAIYDAGYWSYLKYSSFGGDFYTYIYHAVYYIGRMIPDIGRLLGWIIMAIGAAIGVTSLRSLLVEALDNKSSYNMKGMEIKYVCTHCGGENPILKSETPQSSAATYQSMETLTAQPNTHAETVKSDKDWLVTLLLVILVGGIGVHRFYVGKIGTGIIWLLTGGCFMVGWIIDLVKVATGTFQDKEGKVISRNTK